MRQRGVRRGADRGDRGGGTERAKEGQREKYRAKQHEMESDTIQQQEV